jgi:hypothetical protein
MFEKLERRKSLPPLDTFPELDITQKASPGSWKTVLDSGFGAEVGVRLWVWEKPVTFFWVISSV